MSSVVTSYDAAPTMGTETLNISESDQGRPWCAHPVMSARENLTEANLRYCYRTYEKCEFRIIIDIYVVGPLSVLGLIGNLLAFIVLRSDSSNKMVSFLLQALAIADNAYLLICLLLQVTKAVNDCTNWMPILYLSFAHMEMYIWPLASVTQMTGVWLVVLVTLDRYLAICHPFHRSHSWMNQHARKVAVLIPIIALLYNTPRFLEQCVIYGPDLCNDNLRRAWSIKTALRNDDKYIFVYKTLMFFVFRMIIPLLSLTILNIKLMLTLKEASRDRRRLTTSQPDSRDSFTLILVSIVSVFILCQVPDFIVRAGMSIKTYFGGTYDYTYWNTVTNMLLCLNSSVNVVIYCLTGKRFRSSLVDLICHPIETMRRGPSSRLRHITDTRNSRHTNFTMVSLTENANGTSPARL